MLELFGWFADKKVMDLERALAYFRAEMSFIFNYFCQAMYEYDEGSVLQRLQMLYPYTDIQVFFKIKKQLKNFFKEIATNLEQN